jgi:hypothetical protein
MAEWVHFADFWRSFPAADYVSSTGNDYFRYWRQQVPAGRGDFDEQSLYIQQVLTQQEYDRKNFF